MRLFRDSFGEVRAGSRLSVMSFQSIRNTMHLFPLFEKNRSIRFPFGGLSVESSRLMLALTLSVLAHAMVVLPASVRISARGDDGVPVVPYIAARLVDLRNGRSPEEGTENVQVASEEQTETTEERRPQSQSDDIPPDSTAPGKDDSPLSQRSPGVGIEVPELRYFLSDLLTVRPYPLTQLESPELRKPLLNGSVGKVVLRVWVSDVGEVTAIETEFADMPIAVYEAFVTAFRRMRFKPGEIDGKPVGSILRIEMSYEDIRLSVAE